MIFLFFGEKAREGKGFGVANVNRGFEKSASYQQVTSKLEGELDGGDKSGIWRFYRRVWKNIFYERRDKEKRDGVFGGGEENFGLRRMEREERENLYFFKIF